MAGTRAQRYKPEVIEQIRKKLASLPEATPRELTRTHVVNGLAKQIAALRKRGYSMRAIAEVISGEGVAVTAATLRGCLGQSRTNWGAVQRRRPRVRPSTTGVDAGVPSPSTQGELRKGRSGSAKGTTVEHVRKVPLDVEVDNGNRVETSKVDEGECDQECLPAALRDAMANAAGGPSVVAGRRLMDGPGHSVEIASLRQNVGQGARLEEERRVHGKVGSNLHITSSDTPARIVRPTHLLEERRAPVVVREDSREI